MIEQIDRRSAGMMFKHLGNEKWTQHALGGRLDDRPQIHIVRHLAKFRHDVLEQWAEGREVSERFVLASAADYMDAIKNGVDDILAPSLRRGARHDWAPQVRVFFYHLLQLEELAGRIAPAD